ncbi:MAG: hypothetical protein PHP26_05325 [Syntrophomonas sp.]|uniref:hypothetical protein n=1 Tax=Syntrophomonas sp. TaxID=2053627 RepID=UPI0026115A89|nr:hypothetical protein [Syntrophomonas sp.]MDD2510388.1 hypothetical protein [Syntrophomonas sp.]MDD3879396.1 hypothetical protein [Syntrophomonas sp.]MDD4625558.1 hypothetical protein [Syntrophomonas sp.]
MLVLLAIILYLIWRGGPYISSQFIVGSPAGTPLGSEGGIFPAIKGTLWLVLLALVFSIVPGLLTAVYLSEYGCNGRLAEMVSLLVQSMSGVPSRSNTRGSFRPVVLQMRLYLCLYMLNLTINIKVMLLQKVINMH